MTRPPRRIQPVMQSVTFTGVGTTAQNRIACRLHPGRCLTSEKAIFCDGDHILWDEAGLGCTLDEVGRSL
jgi:hypothetical protein